MYSQTSVYEMPPKRAPARNVGGSRRGAARGGRTRGGGNNRGGGNPAGGNAGIANPVGGNTGSTNPGAANTGPVSTGVGVSGPTTTGVGAIGGANATNAANAAPTTVAGRQRVVRIVRERLRPHLAHGPLIERYLRVYSWDIDRATAQYQADRASIQNNPPAPVPHMPPPAAPVGLAQPFPPPARASTAAAGTESSGSESSIGDSASDSDSASEEKLINAMRAAAVPYSENIEQERRDAALALRKHLQENKNVKLSCSQAVLLLLLAQWDLGRAAAEFKSLKDASCRLHVHFDHMRSSLPRRTAMVKGDDQFRQDERLALFNSITERADWWSLCLFLKERDYDLVKAVADWYNSGVPPVKHPKHGMGFGIRVDPLLRPRAMPEEASTRPPEHADQDWAPELDVFATEGICKRYKLKIVERPPRKRVFGSIINEHFDTVQPGEANDLLYLMEYFSKQTYRKNRFKNKKYNWDELKGRSGDATNVESTVAPEDIHEGTAIEQTEGIVEEAVDPGSPQHPHNEPPPSAPMGSQLQFDFDLRKHVSDLNSYRRQSAIRITGIRKRGAAQAWVAAESGFLFWLHLQHLCWLMVENVDKAKSKLMPFVVTEFLLQEWTDRMNAMFRGTKPKGAKAPRVDRTSGGLNTQRSRSLWITRKFKQKLDKDKFPEGDPDEEWRAGGKKWNDEHGEEDDEDEQQGDAGEDEAGGDDEWEGFGDT